MKCYKKAVLKIDLATRHLDSHKLAHQICLRVTYYHNGKSFNAVFMFYPSFPYAEQCKFDTYRVVGIFICTCKVLCVLHSCDLCIAHTHCVVFISHAESCELIIAHTESCVFFMFTCRFMWAYYCSRIVLCIPYYHMQSHVYFLCSHAEPCEFLIAHTDSCVVFMFTCRVVWVY